MGEDDGELNPPWERESARYPAVRVDSEPREAPSWGWNPATEQSYAGSDLDDLTGTGLFAAVVPLRPGDRAWSAGVRVPRSARVAEAPVGPMRPAPPGAAEAEVVEEDEQPSAQMRAMRAGNLARATVIVSAALLLSRVLGLLRTTLFASTFGLSVQADAFTNAFVVPDFIFNIVAGGALASAFIPVFTDYLIDKRDRKTAWHIASSALNLSLVALTGGAALVFIFAPQVLNLTMHPYFQNGNPEGPMIVDLTRVMLLQPIFLGGATIAVAILQARQSFVLPAIGQVIYTVSLIGGILATVADNRTGIFNHQLGIYGPTIGVVAGAVLQLVIQLPGLVQAKMQYRPTISLFHPGMREMIRLMIPRLINAAMLYVSVFFNRGLLGVLQGNNQNNDGIIYGYVTAFTLVMLPIGVLGMAVSQASFPTLAAYVAAGEWQMLRQTIMRTVRGVTYLAIPSAMGIIVLADPLSRLILAHGQFDPQRIALVSTPLIYFATGLLGLSLVEILVRSFYALHDTRTAVEVSILQFMFVIGLSVLLLDPMGAGGLALATALGSTGEAAVLLLLLRARLGGLNLGAFSRFFVYVLAASFAAALTAWVVYTAGNYMLPLDPQTAFPLLSRQTGYLAIRLFAAILAACGMYYGFSRVLGISNTVPIERIARRLLRR